MSHSAKSPIVVDLWTMETAAFSAARWVHHLTDAEREQAARFLHAHNRRDYVAAHVLMRRLLADHGVDPKTKWDKGARGKPHLAGRNGDDWRFNLTHTDGFVAAAATQGANIGVDAEDLERTHLDADLARTVFTPTERASLDGLEGSVWRGAFLRQWTQKESVIKMLGTGLSTPLHSFQVLGDPPRVEILDTERDVPDTLFLHVATPTPHHALSLCIENSGRPVDIRHRAFDGATLTDVNGEGTRTG